MSEQTPSVVSDALLPQPTFIGNLKLQPLTLAQYLFLVKINSPLVKPGERGIDEMDMFRAVFVLAKPLADCLTYWAQGAETYDAAVMGFAAEVPLGELDKLGDKLLKHIQDAFATAAKTRNPEANPESPLASPSPATPTA